MSGPATERALMVLPDGAGPIYPERTRVITCVQVAEASAEEALEHLHRRGDPEEADAADLDLADSCVERGIAAFVVLGELVEDLQQDGGGN